MKKNLGGMHMGMFDTIYFEKVYSCPFCGSSVDSTQTKEFDRTLTNFHVKNCISHAEDIRVVKEELFCNKCSKFTGKNVYIAVLRGILVGVTDTLQGARRMLDDMNQEKLILWYHDLFKKFREQSREKENYSRFMRNVINWFENEHHKKKKDKKTGIDEFLFIFDKQYLNGAKDPLGAIKRYLAEKQKGEEE